ncbi:MAG: thiamine pyrophosphate-dependent dehydrogenase E1 component subunit alpha [Proteobacteria bacterium]|nr:thiamine pyrophosphate-dependent dehydrogenase E1 component subunit alpha [Pseudomonadota bacterium]
MQADKDGMRELFEKLVLADKLDKLMYRRMMQGRLLGFYHPGDGGIAPGVAIGHSLHKQDIYAPHHRAHAIPGMIGKNVPLERYLAEHSGKQDGCCRGRSSFHWSFPEFGIYMASGYIGYQFAPTVGWGWAARRKGEGQIVWCSAGDGAYNQGRAHEAMLMAMNWKLPVVFCCENNGMAIHATAESTHPMEHVSSLAGGYGMPAVIVDGQDVFAVAETARNAIRHVRDGNGPIFVEAKTLRFKEHDIGTPDLAGHTPRGKEELDALRERDPIRLATEAVLAAGVLDEAGIDAVHERAEKELARLERFADDSPVARPGEAELLEAVYAS